MVLCVIFTYTVCTLDHIIPVKALRLQSITEETTGQGKGATLVTMKAIIIGGGIAGLSAAVGLRRAGHDVLVNPSGNCPRLTNLSKQSQANT